MSRKRFGPVIFLLLIILLGVLNGCSKTTGEPETEVIEQEIEVGNKNFYKERKAPKYLSKIKGIEKLEKEMDYSKSENWMKIPETADKEVDTIYLYPTVYGTLSEMEEDIADIDDISMHIMALYSAANQASVFEESCNVYAPYYRQFTVDSLLDIIENCPEALPYLASKDLYPMLDYYFENLNEGRPFILAGHSQGSVWLTVILEDYMKEHPQYYKNMVAAYVIGYSVTEDYLAKNPHLKFAQKAEDIGVIISYNTEGIGNKEQYNCVVKEGAVSINPINWKTDETYASTEENLGSLDTDGTIIDHYADASVDTQRGVVICESVKNPLILQEALEKYFGTESFHLQDYSLYYRNLQKNVADRVAAFLESRSPDKK